MVDCVELAALKHTQDVRKFDGEGAPWLQDGRDAANEILGIRNVRQDIVGRDQVCRNPLRGQPCCQ